MNTIEMKKYGRTLTDREYGKSVAASLLEEKPFPLALDFQGVIALGSSCGDEILSALAPKQGHKLRILHANAPVRSCLEKVALDTHVSLEFL